MIFVKLIQSFGRYSQIIVTAAPRTHSRESARLALEVVLFDPPAEEVTVEEPVAIRLAVTVTDAERQRSKKARGVSIRR